MSKYEPNSISPIKLLASKPSFETPKPYETPAKYLTQRNQTIYEEEYYKEKAQRLQKIVKELREDIRILQTQNKQLKTQIQLYRDSRGTPTPTSYVSGHQRKQETLNQSQEIQKLLKQIRILKNNHEMELVQSKNQQKKLTKKILDLEDQLHQGELSWQSKSNQTQGKVQQKNKQLEKQIKELRKSVVIYMEQRDENEQKLQKIKLLLQEKDSQLKEIQERQKNVMEEKVSLEEKLNHYLSKQEQEASQNKKQANQKDIIEESQEWDLMNSQRESRRKDELYEFGVNSVRRNPNKESHFSVHTFNGTRHVPAQEVFEVVESFKSEIHRLEAEIEKNSILHIKQKDDLGYQIERYQKDLRQKDKDIVNLLTKVKPILVEKNSKIQAKENTEQKKDTFMEDKENAGKNAFGVRMLEMFLKKYKMEAF